MQPSDLRQPGYHDPSNGILDPWLCVSGFRRICYCHDVYFPYYNLIVQNCTLQIGKLSQHQQSHFPTDMYEGLTRLQQARAVVFVKQVAGKPWIEKSGKAL